MSFNRMMYDTCQTVREQGESVSILDYVMSPMRFENPSKCRHQLGLVGGTAVSHIHGNLVDLESDLRGQTRLNTKCVKRQYQPIGADGILRNDKTPPIDTHLKHLPTCQMFSYKAVPLPAAMELNQCQRRRV
jgi:hypothetical protein